MQTITAEEKKALKGRGIILNRDQETFSVRILTEDSILNASQMEWVGQAARKFGNGNVAMTVRMQVELQKIPYENIQPLCDFLEEHGLCTGGTGARIRPIVPCKGTVCVHGLFDTQALARQLHQEFYRGWYDVTLPHKFKIGIGGCPNNCIKPGLNDFGIMGQRVPGYDQEKCRGCKRCNVAQTCPMKICTKEDGQSMVRQGELCTNCGKCIEACPFQAFGEQAVGYKILLGGIWGKYQRPATPLQGVYTQDEVVRALEHTLNIWRDQGRAGERFGLFLERVGVDSFTAQLREAAQLH